MKILPALATSLLLVFSTGAIAKDCDHGDKSHPFKAEYFQNLSDEEKAEFTAAKNKLDKMSEEERKAFRKDAKNQWDKLSQADRDAFISKNQGKIDKAVERQKDRMIMRLYGFSLLKNQE